MNASSCHGRAFAALRRCSMLALALALGLLGLAARADGPTCYGKYPNPISDICWQCVFPISIGGFALDMGQEDIENPGNPVCYCPIGVPPYYRTGLSVGFWEPTRLIESVRMPFCFPALDGMTTGGSDTATKPWGATSHTSGNKVNRDSFYQVHVYLNPIMYYLEQVIDQQCMESGSYDLAYMSEYDSAWHDDTESALIEPEATLFTTLPALAACSADCTAATTGFGIRELYWCSGCNGTVYPMDGNVTVHVGGVQASSLLNHRILAKLHRLLIAKQYHGEGAMCEGHVAPIMDKRGYKTQMIWPVAVTASSDGSQWGRCCQPLGRTTQVWGAGKEFPIKGEDFGYQVFRKRNCCMQ
ncbi:MAG: TraU family protein [Rubrivivax sp.]